VRAEDGAALGELALGMLDIPEGRDEQDGISVQPRPQPAQHLARLGGVRGSGYERERHNR
jgi:hypothetical protein